MKELLRTRILGRAKCVPFVLVAFLTGGIVFAQAVSQISGTTRDQSGASVPGVEVTATQTDTGISRKAVTDESGSFVLPNLPIGPYRLDASKTGFRTYSQTGIQLQVDSSPVVPIVLGIGDVTQTVEVEANVALVETEKLGVGTVMESQRVLDLPLNGRNATDLISLTPGAVQTGTSPSFGMNTGVTISVAGGLNYGVYYALDGAPHLNLYDSTSMPLPFPDALQEFKVDTSTQNAQAGVHSGAQVNAVTKSGTNSFHGDAFEFFRNGDLNARNFFSPTQDTLKRNQFGGVIGGPIKKNKLFFFGGYQGTTLRQTPAPSTTFVPTAAMEAGDFSTFTSPACNGGKQVTLTAPYTTINGIPNQLSASLISPQAEKIAAYYPPALNGCGQFLTSTLLSEYYWQIPLRVDYQLSDKQSVFGRYLVTKQNQVVPYLLSPKNLLTANTNGTNDMAEDAAIGHTWLISATKVNSFRLSLNRIGMDHPGPHFFGPSNVGINAYSYISDSMWLAISGGPTIGVGVSNQTILHATNGGINDDFSLIHGSHQFSFGGDVLRSKVIHHSFVRATGDYTFTGQLTGLGWADVFAGQLGTMEQSLPPTLQESQNFFALYAQDTWKVTSRLTVNYGIRWEPFFPMQSLNNYIYTFSLARFYAGTESKVWTNAPPGFYYPGDPGFNGSAGLANNWKDFAPRIGIAWDPFGDGKTSIRAGVGTGYDFVNQQFNLNTENVAPFSGDTIVHGPIPLASPWSTTPGGNPFPFISTPPTGVFSVGSVFLPVPPDLKTTTTYSWNLALQRQFTPSLFASASYVGSHAIHVWDNIELNPTTYIAGNCVAGQYGLTAPGPCSSTANINNRRLLNLQEPVQAQAISYLTAFDDGGTVGYNGLLLATQWRATSSVSVNANYTWSHCIGGPNTTAGSSNSNVGTNYFHLNDRNLDMGNCPTDRRQVFNLTVVARTPNFSGKALHVVASGWSLSAIYRYSTGAPFSIGSGLDQALAGFTGERASQVLSNTAASNQGAACANVTPCVSWLNSSAFAQPALGTLGNMGVFNVLGPKFFQFDMAIVREFRVREKENIQFRAEAFNVFNNVRFNNPAATLSNLSTFGHITSAQDPRILQLAMKFVF